MLTHVEGEEVISSLIQVVLFDSPSYGSFWISAFYVASEV